LHCFVKGLSPLVSGVGFCSFLGHFLSIQSGIILTKSVSGNVQLLIKTSTFLSHLSSYHNPLIARSQWHVITFVALVADLRMGVGRGIHI
jgi:hypothetical protein